MKKFQSVRNGEVVVELVSNENDRVIIRYESGEEKNISPSTLKRWWRELPEEAETVVSLPTDDCITEEPDDCTQEEEPAQEAESADDTESTDDTESADDTEPAQDPAPVAEPKTTSDKKTKAKKEQKAPKEKITGDHPLKVYIESLATQHETEVFIPSTVPSFRSLKVNGKMYMAFTFNIKGVTLWLRSKAIPTGLDYKSMNHMFDARIKFTEDSQEARAQIKQLLEASLEYQKSK